MTKALNAAVIAVFAACIVTFVVWVWNAPDPLADCAAGHYEQRDDVIFTGTVTVPVTNNVFVCDGWAGVPHHAPKVPTDGTPTTNEPNIIAPPVQKDF